MYQNCCKKCGSVSLHVEEKGNNKGLYCDDCGAWIKWLGKDELNAFEYCKNKSGKEKLSKLPTTSCDVPMPPVKSHDKNKTLRKCSGKYYNHGYHDFELGYFHQWGYDFEDNSYGYIGNFSVAIVELPDGTIVMPRADDVKFLEPVGE